MGKLKPYVAILLITFFAGCKKTATEAPLPPCGFVSFRYYNNARLDIGPLSNDYIFVAFNDNVSNTDIRKFISSVKELDQTYKYRWPERTRSFYASVFWQIKCNSAGIFWSHMEKDSVFRQTLFLWPWNLWSGYSAPFSYCEKTKHSMGCWV